MEVVGVVAVVAEVRQEQPVVVVENAKAIQQTCYRALFQTSSPCHLSSPWPLQICLSHLAPVHSSFAEIYHANPYSSCSPSQSHRLVILAWLAAIETQNNMILQTTRKRWWWWCVTNPSSESQILTSSYPTAGGDRQPL